MELKAKVIPNSSKREIIPEARALKVHLTARPEKGEANKELIELLAKYFKVKKSQITILKGLKSREKTIEITN